MHENSRFAHRKVKIAENLIKPKFAENLNKSSVRVFSGSLKWKIKADLYVDRTRESREFGK